MRSHWKKIIAVMAGMAAIVAIVALPHFANAADGGLIGSALQAVSTFFIVKIAWIINGILGFIASLIFRIAGFLIVIVMSLNANLLVSGSNGNPMLFLGWEIFLNIANLALIVGMIVIAFATMLKIETYGMKRILWKLIVVALLINFSLVLTGVIIDFAGILTDFFVRNAGLTDGKITEALAQSFQISRFMDIQNSDVGRGLTGALADNMQAGFMVVANVFFITAFTILAAIVLLTFALAMFVRYVVLTFMLMITPLVFVAWIFPSTVKEWHKWWQKFYRWVAFAPIMMLGIYLAVKAMEMQSTMLDTLSGQAGGAPSTVAQSLGNSLAFPLGALVNMMVSLGFLIGAIIAANSFSITGGKAAHGAMMGMYTKSVDYAQRKGREARREARLRAQALPGAALGAEGQEKLKTRAEALKAAEAARKPGLLGWAKGRMAGIAGRGLETGVAAVGEKPNKALVDDARKRLEKMKPEDLALRYGTLNQYEKAAALEILAKAGKLDKMPADLIDREIGNPETRKQFERIGQKDAYESIEKSAMRNTDMVKAHTAYAAATAVPEASRTQQHKDDIKTFEDAAKAFHGSLKREDFDKLDIKRLKDPVYGKELAKNMLMFSPTSAAKILGKTKNDKEFDDAQKFIQQVSEDLKKEKAAAFIQVEKDAIFVALMQELDAELTDMGVTDIGATVPNYDTLQGKLEYIKNNDRKRYKGINGGKGFGATSDDLLEKLSYIRESNRGKYDQLKGTDPDKRYEDHEKVMRMVRSMSRTLSSQRFGGQQNP